MTCPSQLLAFLFEKGKGGIQHSREFIDRVETLACDQVPHGRVPSRQFGQILLLEE